MSESEHDSARLEQILARIDGRGYKAYRDLEGRFVLPELTLYVDHVQGDPFAEPSRVRLVVEQSRAAFPPALFDTPQRRVATSDFLLRRASARATEWGRVTGGTGHSGVIEALRPGQEVLERSGVRLDQFHVELRLRIGLPASGRRVLARGARTLLGEALPRLARDVLHFSSLDEEALVRHVRVVEDQVALRSGLRARGLVAFLADGSILPRQSGVDARPLPADQAVPLITPPSLAVELPLADGGIVRGLGIPEGVTLIVGGGFHGKSTLLRALAMGVYDHLPEDGRHRCVTRDDAVKIRAEDGRSIGAVDISSFIGELPGGRQTRSFTTANASGSTSQAAATVEALEAGSRLLLIDEDTSATNFMIRDGRMQRLVPASSEPIVPFVERIRELWERFGVSTILVMGGSGDYLDRADHVIQMDAYRPREVTERAREVAGCLDQRLSESRPPLARPEPRRPDLRHIDARAGRRDKLVARGLHEIQIGRSTLDLTALEQLAERSQTRGIADALAWLRRQPSGEANSLEERLDALEVAMARGGLDEVTGWPAPDRARARRFEVAAALNRYRGLRFEQ